MQQCRPFATSAPLRQANAVASYQCSVCLKGFRLQNALNHHILTRHGGDAKVILIGKDGKPLPEGAAPAAPAAASPAGAARAAPGAARPSPTASPSSRSAPGSGPASAPGLGAAPSSRPMGMGMAAAAAQQQQQQAARAAAAAASAAAQQQQQQQAAAPSAAAAAAEEGDTTGSTDANEKRFVCTICQKTFRLEHALHHHYQAKHNIESPTAAMMGRSGAEGADAGASAQSSSSAAPTTPSGGAAPINPFGMMGGAQAGSFAAAAGAGAAARAAADTDPLSTSNYVHGSADGSGAAGVGSASNQPQTWQYHLDVAPNAPEEGEMAAHWRLVNHGVFLGTVQDVQEGFVFEEPVVQFVLATQFESPSPGDPDKDLHTVRVYGGGDFASSIRAMLRTNKRVMVTGRVRLVPQYEHSTNKFYHYPIVMVHPGSGSVMEV